MSVIKTCTMCNDSWGSIEDILADKDLVFCGYQPFFTDPEKSLFLFTHNKDNCGTTLSFYVSDFKELLGEEVSFDAFIAGEALDCEGHCLDSTDLSRCNSKTCPGVVVRDLIQVMIDKNLS